MSHCVIACHRVSVFDIQNIQYPKNNIPVSKMCFDHMNLCFQLFSGLLCTTSTDSALVIGFCIHVGTSGAVQWWVQVSEGRNCWKRYRRTNKFPMNIWRWVSLLNVGFMILWYSKNWNPEIWKFPEEKKSLHSLNSAIKELVYSFFNFDSEETSRISDKKDTDHATKKKTHQNGSNDSIVANGFLGQLWPVC